MVGMLSIFTLSSADKRPGLDPVASVYVVSVLFTIILPSPSVVTVVAHAPSNAEENVIVGVQVNSSDVAPDSNRKINITVPTKTSDLANDSGYITETTTYDLGANQNAANGDVKITLAGSDASSDEVKISGTGAATVTTDA